jgi:hypothetical protein
MPDFDVNVALAANLTNDRLAEDLERIASDVRVFPPATRSERLREAARRLAATPDDDDATETERIASSLEIFPQNGGYWLTLTGEMFGPFATQDEAINAIPHALRSID